MKSSFKKMPGGLGAWGDFRGVYAAPPKALLPQSFLLQSFLVAFLLISPAHAVSDPREMLPDPQQEARAEAIGSQLRCLVCQNESIEDSDAQLAKDLRAKVREQVKAGQTDAQIVGWMVARYGNFVRLRPPLTAATFLLYATPILALLAGAAAALLGRARQPVPPAPLTQAERARLTELGVSEKS